MKGPLYGCTVLELGARSAVATCGRLLAQLGASVVAVEPRIPCGDGKWADRNTAMLGKLSVSLDESVSADADLLSSLLGAADVVLLSTDLPGHFARMGGKSTWNGARPHWQVMCDLTAFGHTGPLAGRTASELEVQAVAGIMDTTGRADGPPLAVGVPVLETSTALYAVASILVASRVRRMHGIGQRIDVCMYDAAVHSLSSFLTSHFAGQKAGRAGNGHTLTSPWGAYPAKDGFVIICTITNDQFKRLCELAGQPALASDPRFTSPAGRRKHVEVVDTLVSSLTQGRTVGAAIADLSRIGIPCGPIIDKADLAREPNMRHRRMFVGAEEATTGAHWLVPASPLRCEPPMSTTADRIALPDEDRMVVTRLIERCRRSHYPPGTTAAEDIRPLQGVRVVEIGQYTLAPFATRQMSALGADVIKVEPPQGDAIRKTAGAGGKSQIFAMMNTDKRGLVLDLNSEADREVLHQLLSQSDVLVENLKPGTLAGFGLSNEVLRQRYPQLVYCALSGFGADSAYPGRAALDTVVQGMSGLMSATTEDGVPYKTGYSASDLTGSYFGMLAILAGIEMHARYGIAPHFDIAMQDATAWLTTVATAESANLRAHRIVECADGHVLVEGNTAHLRELQSRFDDERDVAVAELQRKGYIATLVRSVAEVVKHPQTASRELLIKRSTLAGEEDIVLGCPLVLRGTPPRVGRLMAALGADTPEVVADLNLKQPRRTAAPLEGAG